MANGPSGTMVVSTGHALTISAPKAGAPTGDKAKSRLMAAIAACFLTVTETPPPLAMIAGHS